MKTEIQKIEQEYGVKIGNYKTLEEYLKKNGFSSLARALIRIKNL